MSAGQGVGTEREAMPPASGAGAAPRPFTISTWRACQLLIALRWQRTCARIFGSTARSEAPSALSHWPLLLAALLGLASCTGFGLVYGVMFRGLQENGGGGLASSGAFLLLLCVVALCMFFNAGNKDLNQLDADMEWLLTLPIPIAGLRAVKVIERSLLGWPSWLFVYPSIVGLVSHGNWSLALVPLSVALSSPLFVLIALAYVVLEDALRLYASRIVINAAQIIGTIAGIAGMTGVMRSFKHIDVVAPVLGFAWLPTTQIAAVAAAVRASSLAALWHAALLLGSSAICAALGFAWLMHVAQQGPRVGAGARVGERGRTRLIERVGSGNLTRAVLANELQRLLRDRTTFIGAVLMPGLITVTSLPALIGSVGLEKLFGSPRHLPALAFGIAAMSLLQASMTLLVADGRALWLLYTVPRSLTTVLWRKAVFWLLVALAFLTAFTTVGLRYQAPSAELASNVAYAVIMLGVLAVIGACLSLYVFDPTLSEQGEHSSTRQLPYSLLYLLMVAAAGAGVYGNPYQQLGALGLLGAAALALWQDIERQVPFLLEPTLKPPPIIQLSDGLVAAFMFAIVQAIAQAVLMRKYDLETWPALVTSFAFSGLMIGGGTVFLLQVRGVPSLFDSLGLSAGAGLRDALKWGLYGALPAALVSSIVVLVIHYSPALQSESQQVMAERGVNASTTLPSVILLTVVLAPLCEELIFRGLVYKGLRAALSPAKSIVLASLIFALVHPPVAFVPVFLMACSASFAFERSRSLLSPVIVHAAYNLALFVVGALVS